MSVPGGYVSLFESMDKKQLDFKNKDAREKTTKEMVAYFTEKVVVTLSQQLNDHHDGKCTVEDIKNYINQQFGDGVVERIQFNMEVNSNDQVVLSSSVKFKEGAISTSPFNFKDFLKPGYSGFSAVGTSNTGNSIFDGVANRVNGFLKAPDKVFVDDLKMALFKAKTKNVSRIYVVKEFLFDSSIHADWLAKVREESIVITGPNSSRSKPSPLLNELKTLVAEISKTQWNAEATVSIRPSFKAFVLKFGQFVDV